MASSNRHWPSMFKSKPCNSHHQWQHDINPSLISNPCHKTPYSSGCEERSPEPKPRWNPKPEQIRILEAIFNSGMVNPPREEIRKIRAQLQEYGQVGDANVFYWFQNRKSRSKHKQRHVQTEKPQANAVPTAISSSSSSSEKSSPRADKALALGGGTSVIDLSNSPTASVNQPYFQSHGDFPLEPFTFQLQAGSSSLSQGYCFSELSNIVQMPEPEIGPCSGLLNELMNQEASKKQMEENQTYVAPPPPPVTAAAAPPPIPTNTSSALSEIRGVGESGGAPPCPARSTVFINDVAFEVSVGPINVREAFGEEAVLIHSSGQPVLTNEWGVTLQSLQHGAFYYLVRLV